MAHNDGDGGVLLHGPLLAARHPQGRCAEDPHGPCRVRSLGTRPDAAQRRWQQEGDAAAADHPPRQNPAAPVPSLDDYRRAPRPGLTRLPAGPKPRTRGRQEALLARSGQPRAPLVAGLANRPVIQWLTLLPRPTAGAACRGSRRASGRFDVPNVPSGNATSGNSTSGRPWSREAPLGNGLSSRDAQSGKGDSRRPRSRGAMSGSGSSCPASRAAVPRSGSSHSASSGSSPGNSTSGNPVSGNASSGSALSGNALSGNALCGEPPLERRVPPGAPPRWPLSRDVPPRGARSGDVVPGSGSLSRCLLRRPPAARLSSPTVRCQPVSL